MPLGDGVQGGAVLGEQRLVGRDDARALLEGRGDQGAGGLDAADDLHHDVDVAAFDEGGGVGGDQLGGYALADPVRAAHGDAGQLDGGPDARREIVRVRRHDACHLGADHSTAQQRHLQRTRTHHPTSSLRASPGTVPGASRKSARGAPGTVTGSRLSWLPTSLTHRVGRSGVCPDSETAGSRGWVRGCGSGCLPRRERAVRAARPYRGGAVPPYRGAAVADARPSGLPYRLPPASRGWEPVRRRTTARGGAGEGRGGAGWRMSPGVRGARTPSPPRPGPGCARARRPAPAALARRPGCRQPTSSRSRSSSVSRRMMTRALPSLTATTGGRSAWL